jgi:phenylpropionate dioxygenase-like ring-hydroxylating dioxygenase large terminal subunit
MGDLSSAFESISSADVDPDADWSLPGWIYAIPNSPRWKWTVIRPSWQIVCHESDLDRRRLAHAGILRRKRHCRAREDGQIRAFTNLCRHRAMRLVEGHAGCAKAGLPLSRLDL